MIDSTRSTLRLPNGLKLYLNYLFFTIFCFHPACADDI